MRSYDWDLLASGNARESFAGEILCVRGKARVMSFLPHREGVRCVSLAALVNQVLSGQIWHE